MENKKLQITDQYGELLLEFEIGDKYHQLILQEGLNKILKESVEHWEKNDADYYTGPEPVEDDYVVKVEEDVDGCAVVNLPDELLEQMGWKSGDNIGIEEAMNCYDDFEVPSLVLRNLTKEKEDEK